MRQSIQAPGTMAPASPYSQANVATGKTVYVSGQVSNDLATGKAVPGNIRVQTEQVINNLKTVLAASGASLSDVVRCGVYLTDMNNFAEMNAIYREHFSAPFPSRSTIECGLAPGYIIEIDCVAVIQE